MKSMVLRAKTLRFTHLRLWQMIGKHAENLSKKPYSYWKFWWLCIKEAWVESREKFGLLIDILLFLAAILWVVFVWYSKHHSQFNVEKENGTVSYWFAIIPAGLWVLWFLYHVPKASYKIYKEQFEERARETGELLQKVKDLESKIDQFFNQRAPLLVECRARQMPNIFKLIAKYFLPILI